MQRYDSEIVASIPNKVLAHGMEISVTLVGGLVVRLPHL
jgi:hypothetical protein